MTLKRLTQETIYTFITGKIDKIKTSDNKIKEVFIPAKRNPHPTLFEIERDTKLSRHSILVQEGLIYPPLIINREEFKKTESEKDRLKHLKFLWKKSLNVA